MNVHDLNRPIEELCLSTRKINQLRKGEVFTLRDLVGLTAKQWVDRTSMTESCFDELADELGSLGLSVGMTVDGDRVIRASSANLTGYPPPADPDPARYVQFYSEHGYSFLPQSLMESFYCVIADKASRGINASRESIPTPSRADGTFENYTGWKDFCYYDSQIREWQGLPFFGGRANVLGVLSKSKGSGCFSSHLWNVV